MKASIVWVCLSVILHGKYILAQSMYCRENKDYCGNDNPASETLAGCALTESHSAMCNMKQTQRKNKQIAKNTNISLSFSHKHTHTHTQPRLLTHMYTTSLAALRVCMLNYRVEPNLDEPFCFYWGPGAPLPGPCPGGLCPGLPRPEGPSLGPSWPDCSRGLHQPLPL